MIMHDYNAAASKAAILIHPMLSSAEGARECLPELWSEDARWLLPDLSAHGDAVAGTYRSASDEAKAIHDYLIEHGAHIYSWASAHPWRCCAVRASEI